MKEYVQVYLDPDDFIIYSPAEVESGENLKSVVVDPVNLEFDGINTYLEGPVIGGKSFPTNSDIESISELFPDDNLFETLNDPIKLQDYYTELKNKAEELIQKKVDAKKAKKEAELSKTAAELAEVVEQASVYALKESSPVQPRIEKVMADAVKTLSGLVKLAEEYEVAAIKEAQEKEAHQRVLEQVRAQNSEEA